MTAKFLPVLVVFLSPHAVLADEPVNYGDVDVKPLLRERCYSCHGVLKAKGGLRLDSVAFMKDGGDHDDVLVPGKADQSLVITRGFSPLDKKRMPPLDQGEALTEKQVALLKRWINEGAKAPANDRPEEDPRTHWAFRTPQRPNLPAVKEPTRNPIDAFVIDARAIQGLSAQGPAVKDVLLRRVYLDLIGLPPTRAELQKFRTDSSPDAYEKVVDHLLAQPQYGQRWGRHWMDVWRYSDWYGRRRAENDVRNSVAADLAAPAATGSSAPSTTDRGYDLMLQDMLAAKRDSPGRMKTAQVATGYIVRNWYALNPHQWMRDMVEHTGKAFLGLTMQCAHCHDHKYDPISQEEYFRFRAFFEPLGVRQDRLPGEPDPGPFGKYDYGGSRKPNPYGRVSAFDEKLTAVTSMYMQGDERLKVPNKKIIAGRPDVPGRRPPAHRTGRGAVDSRLSGTEIVGAERGTRPAPPGRREREGRACSDEEPRRPPPWRAGPGRCRSRRRSAGILPGENHGRKRQA